MTPFRSGWFPSRWRARGSRSAAHVEAFARRGTRRREGRRSSSTASLASVERRAAAPGSHDRATWAMAEVLETAQVPDVRCDRGRGLRASLRHGGARAPRRPRRAGDCGPGTVIGHPGFGWARGDGGQVRAIPQLGGVVIEDDVYIGPLCTIDAGRSSPTRIRCGAKLDAQIHVGHNADIGEGRDHRRAVGFRRLGHARPRGAHRRSGGDRGPRDGGEGARAAAKSGVIGDVPAGTVVAGYPAVARVRWLRALARAFRGL